ncbi:hypothetical protein [Cyanobium sp. ATX-6F1]|uniref:hypothetical protein n=1 Tax=Cyanobium sp. ATX-6F1 TaxID=3137388 RepID=UPI0039BE44B8
MSVRSDAVVSHVELDRSGSRAEAVVYVERLSRTRRRETAPLVVLCASTIESVRLLLASGEDQRAGGLVDPSGGLGHGLMDHISSSRFFRLPDQPAPRAQELSGAGSVFIPNTVNLEAREGLPFLRGYGLWGAVQRFDPPGMLKRRRSEAVGFLIGHGEMLSDPATMCAWTPPAAMPGACRSPTSIAPGARTNSGWWRTCTGAWGRWWRPPAARSVRSKTCS